MTNANDSALTAEQARGHVRETLRRHTPGPWEARADRTVAAGGTPLLRCYAGRNEVANARLAAAAPDLLDACVKAANALADFVSSDADFLTLELASELLTALDAASSKAFGYDSPNW